MCNRKKQTLKMAPTFLVTSAIILSGALKISGYHPMLLHFVEMGLYNYLTLFGALEIIFAFLFLFPQTARAGLLLLTAYFGGAMAVEIPYGMIAAPAIPLVLVWVAAFIREPAVFIQGKNNSSFQLKQTSHE